MWTEERVELLKRLVADKEKLTAQEIAERLGGFEGSDDGGRSAVLGKVHRLKLQLQNEPGKNKNTHKKVSATGTKSRKQGTSVTIGNPASMKLHPNRPPRTTRYSPVQPRARISEDLRLHQVERDMRNSSRTRAFPPASDEVSDSEIRAIKNAFYKFD